MADITERKKTEDHVNFLLREMSHRSNRDVVGKRGPNGLIPSPGRPDHDDEVRTLASPIQVCCIAVGRVDAAHCPGLQPC